MISMKQIDHEIIVQDLENLAITSGQFKSINKIILNQLLNLFRMILNCQAFWERWEEISGVRAWFPLFTITLLERGGEEPNDVREQVVVKYSLTRTGEFKRHVASRVQDDAETIPNTKAVLEEIGLSQAGTLVDQLIENITRVIKDIPVENQEKNPLTSQVSHQEVSIMEQAGVRITESLASVLQIEVPDVANCHWSVCLIPDPRRADQSSLLIIDLGASFPCPGQIVLEDDAARDYSQCSFEQAVAELVEYLGLHYPGASYCLQLRQDAPLSMITAVKRAGLNLMRV